MARKRVSPTILTDGVSLVKGEKFNSWRTVGSVIAAAQVFSLRDVDELTLLDVCATSQDRVISEQLISAVSSQMMVPLVIGGGVKDLHDFERVLRAGADKVILGTAAIENPNFVTDAAQRFGSQAVVVSVDVANGINGVVTGASGTLSTGMNPAEFASKCENLGAGELILQNVDRDGTMQGMDITLIKQVCSSVNIPVIASGGAGSYQDILEAFSAGASAVSAGAMFQFTEQTPRGARDYLHTRGVDIRMSN